MAVAFLDADSEIIASELSSFFTSNNFEGADQNTCISDIANYFSSEYYSFWQSVESPTDVESTCYLIANHYKGDYCRMVSLVEFISNLTISRNINKYRILKVILSITPIASQLCSHVYSAIINCCKTITSLEYSKVDSDEIARVCSKYSLSPQNASFLYLKLADAYEHCDMRHMAVLVRSESLKFLQDDETKVIRILMDCFKDPALYLFYQLRDLPCVEKIKGSPAHELLMTFIRGRMDRIDDFCRYNSDFLAEYDLPKELVITKLRVLTLLDLANSGTSQFTFEEFERELSLSGEEIDRFVDTAIQSGLVKAKINQVGKSVRIMFHVPRYFETSSWDQLLTELQSIERKIAY